MTTTNLRKRSYKKTITDRVKKGVEIKVSSSISVMINSRFYLSRIKGNRNS